MMKPLVIALLLSLMITSTVFGQSDALRKKHFNAKKDIALEGYDPVSYFDGNPLEGKETLKVIYKGITYYFASSTNVSKFKANSDKYEPAYGGWCAYAMGESGEKVKIDPETFKIIDGKLYLFYNFWGNNTLDDWNENEKKLKEDGNRNWAKITQL
jgi:YHS domain-containing protein